MKLRRALWPRPSSQTQPGMTPAAEAPITTAGFDVIRPMPRRRVSHSIDSVLVDLPRARRVEFKAGIIRPIGRLFVWLWGFLRFYFGNTLDVFLRRSSDQRRAVRLRRVFEDAGATFAKLGQQLSMRADMLPYAYCAELGKMLDQAPAFPTQQAVEIIERNLGGPLSDVFDVFDPEPIGSASLACVYQAQLKTGEKVAVKVRRPGIGPLIAADLRALDWILILGETLTIIPPGVTRRFRQDFETILFNELNFRAEARYTDIFRRRAAKRKKGVTAPQVYFKYCSEEVMVSELVSGVWMWELMAAVDSNDQEFLAKVRRIGIEPKALARKLVLVMQHEVQEELFFHADPHPANLVIMPNNGICFIDFGAIGRFSTQTRKTFRELQHHMVRGDIGRMVNCALSLAGPLPPMDVETVRVEMEKIYADTVYAMKSKDAEWWEKSSAQAWLRFLEVSQQFSLPASFETIQYFRTSFAYDAIVIAAEQGYRRRQGVGGLQAASRQGSAPARAKKHAGEAPRTNGHGLSPDGGVRRYGHPVLLPAAAQHREPNHPLQEHRGKNRLHRIPGDEAGLHGCCCSRHWPDRRRRLQEMVRSPNRLGLHAGSRNIVWMGAAGIDCGPPDTYPQNCDPAEYARHSARS